MVLLHTYSYIRICIKREQKSRDEKTTTRSFHPSLQYIAQVLSLFFPIIRIDSAVQYIEKITSSYSLQNYHDFFLSPNIKTETVKRL
jgi:hypothetical protein